MTPILGLALFTSLALAQPESIKPKVASLVTSPGQCELIPGEADCEEVFNFIWEAPLAGDYCIRDKEKQELLSCWLNSWRGTAEIYFFASQDRGYELIRFVDEEKRTQVVASVVVSVTGSLEQRYRSQRRRKGFWRIF